VSKGIDSNNPQPGKPSKTKTVTTLNSESKNVTKKPSLNPCPLCKGSHGLWKCDGFKDKTPTERAEFVKTNSLCFTCLGTQHVMRNCTRQRQCGVERCKQYHHRLLHGAERVSPKTHGDHQERKATVASANGSSSAHIAKTVNKGLLQVVKVEMVFNGVSTRSWALCDSGSTHSWVSTELQNSLKLTGIPTRISLESFDRINEYDTQQCKVKVQSTNKANELEMSVLVKPNFSIGSEVIDVTAIKKAFPHLNPVPDGIINLKDVHILLGQDAYQLIRPLEYRNGSKNESWAVRIPLGWALSGPLPQLQREQMVQTTSNVVSADVELTSQVKRWWDMESYASACSVDSRSREDKRATQILDSETKHNGERYVIPLLWAHDSMMLPNNYASAKAQLLSLEKRLERDPDLKRRYQETIDKDLQSGYVRPVTDEELRATASCNQWYLPHHPVLNPNKPDKVRRVCNAASKFRGTSLNDALLTGPDLLNNLVGILMRFRTAPFAVSADIEAMFLQVEVTEGDQCALRFLWREDPSQDICVLQYTRRIFSAKPSPTCANYAVQQTARDFCIEGSEVTKAIFKNFYMDDFLKCVDNSSDAVKLCIDVINLLKKGGFNLTKFASNSKEVLNQLSKNGTVVTSSGLEKDTSLHVLGIKWSTDTDTLVVSRGTTKTPSNTPTQREVLSCVSAVFDPLGLVAPFTVRARLLLKRIWQTQGQSWDEPIDSESQAWFKQWIEDLHTVHKFTIPRQYFENKVNEQQLHVFADASLEAMCAVVYLRGTHENETQVSFVVGKARVSPFRSQTIPKLELQAAVIACRLHMLVSDELDFNKMSTVFWSDSTTVLQWIKGSHKKQPVFVANRVAEILEHSSVDQWKHVPGEQNPADCGTRGMAPSDLKSSIWLNGPAFLKEPESLWPEQKLEMLDQQVEASTTNKINAKATEPLIQWSRFSNFRRLVAVVARVYMVCTGQRRSSGPTADDLTYATRLIWKLVQRESFSEELHALEKGNGMPIKSRITTMSPFLAADGLIRAKGRLRKSDSMTFDTKHPIILSCQHPVVKLYVIHIHSLHHHEGNEYLRSIIQQGYWILHLRSTLRSIKHQCVQCAKIRAETLKPEMADLPVERLADRTYPFAHTGVDYFGPFEVRFGRKTFKRWCCLFTCLTTRAVHIEVCHSLDADTCVMAIKRFVARRGQPQTLISDNGTNFVGAHKEFKQCLDNWNKGCIEQSLAQTGIKWKFNPPGAPHFGGVWERLVRSCKKAMFNILGRRRLTDDLLQTTMCLVEQTLNARPLTAVSSDVTDLEAITPNHFLIGRPSVCLPAFWTQPNDTSSRKMYRQAESYADMIWKRWISEYAPDLNKRAKWQSDKSSNLDT
jgi:transposase InsO family protein